MERINLAELELYRRPRETFHDLAAPKAVDIRSQKAVILVVKNCRIELKQADGRRGATIVKSKAQTLIPARQPLRRRKISRRYVTKARSQMDWGFADVLITTVRSYRVACFAIHHCGQRRFFLNARQVFIGMIHAFQYMGATDNMKSVKGTGI